MAIVELTPSAERAPRGGIDSDDLARVLARAQEQVTEQAQSVVPGSMWQRMTEEQRQGRAFAAGSRTIRNQGHLLGFLGALAGAGLALVAGVPTALMVATGVVGGTVLARVVSP